MAPPTPFLPTRLHIPADQSLLLATEPIWEDDSVDFGHEAGLGMGPGGGVGGMAGIEDNDEEAFWGTPTRATKAADFGAKDLLRGDAPPRASFNVAPTETSMGYASSTNAQAGPSTSRDTLQPRSTAPLRLNAPSHASTQLVREAQEAERPKYTGMTGRLDRRDRRPAAPIVASAPPVEAPRVIGEPYRRVQSSKIPVMAEKPEKRRREASPVKVPVQAKRAKIRSPVKDDFYSRRVKDSDRRSSLGPKSPLMVASPLPTRSPVVHTGANRSTPSSSFAASSRSSVSSSSRTARPSPLSTTNVLADSPVVSCGEAGASEVTAYRRVDAGSGPGTPATAAAEGSFRGSSALSRYLAKTHSAASSAASQRSFSMEGISEVKTSLSNPCARRDESTSTDTRASTPQTPSIYPKLPPHSPADTPKSGTPLNRSILSLASETVRGIRGALRRSLSRSSLGPGTVIDTSTPVEQNSGLEKQSNGSEGDPEDGQRIGGGTEVGMEAGFGTAELQLEEAASKSTERTALTPKMTTLPIPMPPGAISEETDSITPRKRSSGDASIYLDNDASRTASEGDNLHAEARPSGHTAETRHAAEPARPIPGLPAPLTRPGRPFGTTTASRALQPRSHNAAPVQPGSSDTSKGKRTITGPPTSLAARALARLPPPGATSATSLARLKTSLKENERASQLAEKRARFEALSRGLEDAKRQRVERVVPAPIASRLHTSKVTVGAMAQAAEMKKTVPIRGSTPGKASRARAEARAAYDAELQKRQGERKREEERVERARKEVEEEEYRLKRMETVVRAHELPAMYARRV